MKAKNWWFVLIILTAAFSNCKKDKARPQDKPPTFEDIKTTDWRTKIGDSIEVSGFLCPNDDGTAILLSDKNDIEKNGPIPETKYIALGTEFIRNLNPVQYYLAKVKIRGKVRSTVNPSRIHLDSLCGDLSKFELELLGPPVIIEGSPGNFHDVVDPCKLYPALCDKPGITFPRKFAFLFHSGATEYYAPVREWNDLCLYYYLLLKSGFEPGNIYVLFRNGSPMDNYMPVSGPATENAFNQIFYILSTKMRPTDVFFFFSTGVGKAESDEWSPVPGDEDFANDKIDECLTFYAPNSTSWSQALFDEEVATRVNNLQFSRMICVLQPSYSGGLIYDLRGANRIIISACSETEQSNKGNSYNEFSFQFASALLGYDLLYNKYVDADENKDGKVSVTEAFRYAKDHDQKDETPQYEDSGDGISINYPSDNGSVPDGAYGKNVFF